MPEGTETVGMAKVFAALGNAKRLALVRRLSLSDTFAGQSVGELTLSSGLTRQATTKHLELLEDAGLLTRWKPGRATLYELKADSVRQAMELLEEIRREQAQSQLRLEAKKEKFLSLVKKTSS